LGGLSFFCGLNYTMKIPIIFVPIIFLASFIDIGCDFYYDPIPSNSIQIVKPYHNTEIKIGEYMVIKWESRDVGDYIRIELNKEGVLLNHIDTLAKNSSEYKWYPS